MLGVAQWCSFCIGRAVSLFADVSATQNRKPLRVCRHDAVLDSIVDHLDEIAGAIWAALQVTLFGHTVDLVPADGYVARTAAEGCVEKPQLR